MNSLLNKSNGVIRMSLWTALLLIVLSVAAIGCGDDDKDKTTTSTTSTVSAPAGPSPSGYDDSEPGGGTATEDVTTIEGVDADGGDSGAPTVVQTTDTYGPCIEGMQEVTHYTEYSDGTSASSIAMVPCSDDIVPVEP